MCLDLTVTYLGKIHGAEDPHVAAAILLLPDLEHSHRVTVGKAPHHGPVKHTTVEFPTMALLNTTVDSFPPWPC